ncbi:hypothetical protein [Vibrio barjaei]|uniref:hypothetical protein n=1 Tax=Vibrio barjaei TaxID=1676683 RepID=UPI0022851F16|nr:hypothetical protein [Vibrio barjaei]MCY9870370.1 hypothetical protein [Vibrio barjaei]
MDKMFDFVVRMNAVIGIFGLYFYTGWQSAILVGFVALVVNSWVPYALMGFSGYMALFDFEWSYGVIMQGLTVLLPMLIAYMWVLSEEQKKQRSRL